MPRACKVPGTRAERPVARTCNNRTKDLSNNLPVCAEVIERTRIREKGEGRATGPLSCQEQNEREGERRERGIERDGRE